MAGIPREPATLKTNKIDKWIRTALDTEPLRATSVTVTILGDSVAPHGGSVCGKSLIDLLAPFGINDRLVRTSVYRLAADGWVEARRQGRRSEYLLTANGLRRFEAAHQRIYNMSAMP